MKNLSKNLFYLFLSWIFLSSCQSVKEGLSGKKKTSGDEFLVEKKNPLVLPPEFEKLPEPKTLIGENESEDEEIDLRVILGNDKSSKKISSSKQMTSDSLEKSIIEKIKDN